MQSRQRNLGNANASRCLCQTHLVRIAAMTTCVGAPTFGFSAEALQNHRNRLSGDLAVAAPVPWQAIGYLLLGKPEFETIAAHSGDLQVFSVLKLQELACPALTIFER